MLDDTDTLLVRRFQAGDKKAFEQFIQRHQERLYRLARAFLYDPSFKDDVVQEVFIRAYTGLPKFQFRSKPFSWLYRTLQNVCSEFNKKQGKTTEYLESHDQREALPDNREQKQELKAIFDSLTDLSRRERDVVLLRVFEEFNEAETATALGVRKGTVKSLLHRGLKKIQAKHKNILKDEL